MPINAGDIVLARSAVMDDVPEGGGAITGTVIVDGNSNTIYPDISELDRAGGRVNLRKAFVHVRTPDTDGFFGANVIVAEPFEDPRVSATLFYTGDAFDRREDAVARIEAYLAKGATYSGLLFGDHLEGQMTVVLQQRAEVPVPAIGATLVLTKNQGLVNEFVQFVRVTGVAATNRVFTDGAGDFERVQVVLDLSDRLLADFPGFEAVRTDANVNYTGKTRVSETVVADAARYYGVVPLTEEVSVGDFGAQVQSIFTQLVPSTRVEVPLADARMNGQSGPLVAAGNPVTRVLNGSLTTTQSLFIGSAVTPGSLSVSRGGTTLTDRGGALVDATTAVVGSVDYPNGVVSVSTNVFGAGTGDHTVTWTPAATPTLVNETSEIVVTAESQRLTYAFTLDPAPARGTLQVSYRSQGSWFTLVDDGSGALRAASSSVGAGTLNPATGTVSLTLGALPDVGSSIISVYFSAAVARPVTAIGATGAALPRAVGVPVSLGRPIKPGTLTLTWNDGAARTASESGGLLTGDATGVVRYETGEIEFRPNVLPPKGTAVTVAMTEAAAMSHTVVAFTDGGANWTATLPGTIRAGSVQITVSGMLAANAFVQGTNEYLPIDGAQGAVIRQKLRLFDNGAGVLQYANNGGANTAAGTINYGTGAISISKSLAGFQSTLAYRQRPLDGWSGPTIWLTRTTPFGVENGSPLQADAAVAAYAGGDAGPAPSSFAVDELFLPANPAGAFARSGTAPRLTAFRLGTSYYSVATDAASVARDPSPATGVGTIVGARATVGAATGLLLTEWPAGVSPLVSDVAGAHQPSLSGVGSPLSVAAVVFRTAVSPLVSSGFQVAGNFTATGAGFTATANTSGVILTATPAVGETPGSWGVAGTVDFEMGIARLYFGRRVPASMSAAPGVVNLSGLGIAGLSWFERDVVQADTLRYNATGYSYLPLDEGVLGLSPVRLPADGRVPIFRPGSFAVLGHTGTVGPAAVTNGQVINFGRPRLSRVRAVDNNGAVITSGYSVDLDAGTATVVDTTGWAQPVRFEHRIEDMVLLSGAQITGRLSFTRAATHDYPVPGSYVSSALVIGDMRARVLPAFDQVSWTGVWSDAPIGTNATGTFSQAQFPITVTNAGALTERWAVRFTNTTNFEVLAEHLGVIATGSTGANCAPLNPATGQPYFTIPALGWGAGWATGNVLRFNTVGAQAPVWVARTILQGPETVAEDSFTLLVRGDVDRP